MVQRLATLMRRCLTTICLLLAIFSVAHAEERAKRLILKDGSYQLATKYEVKGDRVRYYSAERFGWEEIPKSIVDWDATNKWEAEAAAGVHATQQEINKEDAAEAAAEDAKAPTVAPGLRLPEDGGVFLLDQFQNKPQLVEIVQNGGELNKHTGKNILIAVVNPLNVAKQTIELKGAKARVQSHAVVPVLYANVNLSDSDQAGAQDSKATKAAAADTDLAGNRYRIAKVEKKKEVRVVGDLKVYITGKVKQEGNWVPTKSEPVSGGWVKVTPAQPLAPGEYALVEMLSPKEMNLYVWDFGVDPMAPANQTAWTPSQPKPLPTGTDETPVLIKPKK
jgi:hypothetical protein